MNVNMDIDTEIDLDYYLIVIHGVTVVSSDTYYNMRFNCNRINFFANFGSTIHFNSLPLLEGNIPPFNINPDGSYSRNEIYFNNLHNMIQNYAGISYDIHTNRLINSITIFPHENDVFKVPSIIFGVSDRDAIDEKKALIGIYKYSKQNPNRYEQVYSIEQLYNYSRQRNTYGILTYRDIIDIIFAINGNNTSYRYNLGFFCCRELNYNFGLNDCYKTPEFINVFQSLFTPIEKMYPRLEKGKNILELRANELPDHNEYLFPLYISTHINIGNIASWKRILDLRQQGCALNVLAFYNFILEPFAHQSTSCLNRDGTSIFRIIDYLHVYLSNRHPSNRPTIYQQKTHAEIALINEWLGMSINPISYYQNGNFPVSFPVNTKYTVLRLSIKFLLKKLNEIFKCLFLLKNTNSVVVILKFYGDIKKNGKYVKAGHTVSFLFQVNDHIGHIYLVDPQNFDQFPVVNPVFVKHGFHGPIELQTDPVSIKFNNEYNSRYKYFDMIYVNNDHVNNIVSTNIQNKVDLNEFLINIKNDDIIKTQFEDKTYIPFSYSWFLPYDDYLISGGKASKFFTHYAPSPSKLIYDKNIGSKAKRHTKSTRSTTARSTHKKIPSSKRSSQSRRRNTKRHTKKTSSKPELLQKSKKGVENYSKKIELNETTPQKYIKSFIDTFQIDEKNLAISQDHLDAIKTTFKYLSSGKVPVLKPTEKSKEFDTFMTNNIVKSKEPSHTPTPLEFEFDLSKDICCSSNRGQERNILLKK